MVSPTVVMVSLAQLFSLHNETVMEFCSLADDIDINFREKRLTFLLQSPKYPQPYKENLDCSIRLKPPLKGPEYLYSMYLSCEDDFEIEPRQSGAGQCSDFLQVDETRTCGHEMRGNIISHVIRGPIRYNGVLLRFKSTAAERSKKAKRKFKCHGIIDVKRGCSQYYSLLLPDRSSQQITGLRLKSLEMAQVDCTFRIKVEKGYQIKIMVEKFNLRPEDGDYCLSFGLDHQFCSKADDVVSRWPPTKMVVDDHHTFVNIRFLTHGLKFNRLVDVDQPAFVLDVSLHRGKESAGSASHMIFTDPNEETAKETIQPPLPPSRNQIYREMMVPIPAPNAKDSCICWEFPSDNVFLSQMAMGGSFRSSSLRK